MGSKVLERLSTSEIKARREQFDHEVKLKVGETIGEEGGGGGRHGSQGQQGRQGGDKDEILLLSFFVHIFCTFVFTTPGVKRFSNFLHIFVTSQGVLGEDKLGTETPAGQRRPKQG